MIEPRKPFNEAAILIDKKIEFLETQPAKATLLFDMTEEIYKYINNFYVLSI